ncbi:hypothetical protein [Candidatus Palauibacter sp.]|uniref:hypothetical protein n=1 Tax=Candidatus Palauibacter sp. TaxID=3101350 RepID=UPI003AF2C7A8
MYATLLDEGVHLCSERTMYRVLAENRAVRERRAQRSHPNHPKPEIDECGPWDTRLLGPEKWRYFYLYVIRTSSAATPPDGWWRSARPPASGHLVGETCLNPRVLTLHSDRG